MEALFGDQDQVRQQVTDGEKIDQQAFLGHLDEGNGNRRQRGKEGKRKREQEKEDNQWNCGNISEEIIGIEVGQGAALQAEEITQLVEGELRHAAWVVS